MNANVLILALKKSLLSDTPGVEIVRNPTVLNHHSPAGHSEIAFRNVCVPAENLLVAEVALEMMIERSQERKTFGKYLHQTRYAAG